MPHRYCVAWERCLGCRSSSNETRHWNHIENKGFACDLANDLTAAVHEFFGRDAHLAPSNRSCLPSSKYRFWQCEQPLFRSHQAVNFEHVAFFGQVHGSPFNFAN